MSLFKKTPTAKELSDTNLGEVLRRLGAITEEELRAAVDAQRQSESLGKKEMLGQVLVRTGVITAADLSVALDVQRTMRSSPRREAVLTLAEGATSFAEARIADCRQSLAGLAKVKA